MMNLDIIDKMAEAIKKKQNEAYETQDNTIFYVIDPDTGNFVETDSDTFQATYDDFINVFGKVKEEVHPFHSDTVMYSYYDSQLKDKRYFGKVVNVGDKID